MNAPRIVSRPGRVCNARGDAVVYSMTERFEVESIGLDGALTGGDVLPGLAINVAELFRKPGEK